MRLIKTYCLILLFILCQNDVFSQPSFSILFEDNTLNMKGEPFFNEVESFLASNTARFNQECNLIKASKWGLYKDQLPPTLNVYFQTFHASSRFVFKFSLTSISADNERKQLKVEAWNKAKYPQSFQEKTVIADLDIFLGEVQDAMPFIFTQIKHTLTGAPPKDALYVSKLSQLSYCESYKSGFEFFIYNPELNNKYYVLRLPCNTELEQADREPKMIACYKIKPEEIEFKFFEFGKLSKKIKHRPLLKLNCESDNDNETRVSKYCEDIVK